MGGEFAQEERCWRRDDLRGKGPMLWPPLAFCKTPIVRDQISGSVDVSGRTQGTYWGAV